jgi:hypothetical protein
MLCAGGGYASAFGWSADGPSWLSWAALLLWFAAGFLSARMNSAVWISGGALIVLCAAVLAEGAGWLPRSQETEDKSVVFAAFYLPVVTVVAAIGGAFGEVAAERWTARRIPSGA